MFNDDELWLMSIIIGVVDKSKFDEEDQSKIELLNKKIQKLGKITIKKSYRR